jgi:hypothetical protein
MFKVWPEFSRSETMTPMKISKRFRCSATAAFLFLTVSGTALGNHDRAWRQLPQLVVALSSGPRMSHTEKVHRDTLNAMKESLDKKGTVSVVSYVSSIWMDLHNPKEEFTDREGLKRRLHALEERLAELGGPEGIAAYGDGSRTTEDLPKDLYGAVYHAARNCDEAKIASIRKHAPHALTYINGQFDARIELVKCAIEKWKKTLDKEDTFVPNKVQLKKRQGCGLHKVYFAAQHAGGGKYLPWHFPSGGLPGFNWDAATEVPCNRIPKQSKAAPEFASAMRDYSRGEQGWTFVVGRPSVELIQGQQWKVAGVDAYSKKMPLPDNPCGGDLICSKAGSRAVTKFEETRHYLERAKHHRDAGRAERCRKNLREGLGAFQDYKAYRADFEAKGKWIQNSRYLVVGIEKPLPNEEFTAKFQAMGDELEGLQLTGGCEKPAK